MKILYETRIFFCASAIFVPRRKRLNHELRRPFFSFAGGSHQAAVVFGDKGLRRFHQEPFTSSTLQGISGKPAALGRSTEGPGAGDDAPRGVHSAVQVFEAQASGSAADLAAVPQRLSELQALRGVLNRCS